MHFIQFNHSSVTNGRTTLGLQVCFADTYQFCLVHSYFRCTWDAGHSTHLILILVNKYLLMQILPKLHIWLHESWSWLQCIRLETVSSLQLSRDKMRIFLMLGLISAVLLVQVDGAPNPVARDRYRYLSMTITLISILIIVVHQYLLYLPQCAGCLAESIAWASARTRGSSAASVSAWIAPRCFPPKLSKLPGRIQPRSLTRPF